MDRLNDLCSNQRLLLAAWFSQTLSSGLSSWHRLELLLRRSREILAFVSRDVLLHGGLSFGDGRGDRAAAATDHLLSLGRVFSNILLCSLGGSCGVVACELLDLLGLLVDHVGGVLEVVVDKLLVGLIDERAEEEDGCGDQGKAPEWDDLDQVVGQESSDEGLEFS
jgi:hypothetical protein